MTTYALAVAAVILSVLLLRGRNIYWVNYLWVLMPIDMYGISVAGFTLKPYMVFMIFVVIYCLGKKSKGCVFSKSRVVLLTLLIATLFIADMFNGAIYASMMQHLMFALVCFFAYVYCAALPSDKMIREIFEVVVATAIGFSLVYLFAWMTYSIGFSWFVAADRLDPGVILTQGTMSNGNFVEGNRLRGFFIDPNVLGCSLVLALSYSLNRIFQKDIRLGEKSRYIVASILCLMSVWLCNSRICTAVLFAICLFFLIRYGLKSRAGLVGMLVLLGVLGLLMLGPFVEWMNNLLTSTYGSRAAASSDYGRFTIWETCFNALISTCPWTGFGENQIQFYISLGLACHNTWLEWICGNGLLVGLFGILYFVSAIFTQPKPGVDINDWMPIKSSYIAIILMLVFVDNLTNSYLIFTLMLLLSMSNHEKVESSHGREFRQKIFT